MPSPRRDDLDDFYTQLPEHQRAHLRGIEEVCLAELPAAQEVLHWNQPAFVQDGKRLVMIQAFSKHASLRFPTRYFATVADEVRAAGHQVGAGFIKLPYQEELPTQLLHRLVRGRREEFEATGLAW